MIRELGILFGALALFAVMLLVGVPLMQIYGDRVVAFFEWWTAVMTRALRYIGFKAGVVPVVRCAGCQRLNRLVGGSKERPVPRCSACHKELAARAN